MNGIAICIIANVVVGSIALFLAWPRYGKIPTHRDLEKEENRK